MHNAVVAAQVAGEVGEPRRRTYARFQQANFAVIHRSAWVDLQLAHPIFPAVVLFHHLHHRLLRLEVSFLAAPFGDAPPGFFLPHLVEVLHLGFFDVFGVGTGPGEYVVTVDDQDDRLP